jgi:hypothetical protein
MKNIGLTLLLVIAFNTRAQNISVDSNCVTNPPDFSKMSYQVASQTVNNELQKRICPEYIKNLVEEIRYGNLGNNKVPAIYLLGELRPHDENSIDVLIENIDLKSPPNPLLAPLRWGEYPAEEALVKIGKPAINPILNHLPAETNELRRYLMCEVVKQVLRNYHFIQGGATP